MPYEVRVYGEAESLEDEEQARDFVNELFSEVAKKHKKHNLTGYFQGQYGTLELNTDYHPKQPKPKQQTKSKDKADAKT